jgi:hypothetical protein
MKQRLITIFFLTILHGTSICQNNESLKDHKWFEDNNIYEGCKTRIDSLNAETNGLKILMKQYKAEIDSISNFNNQISSSMNQIQLNNIVAEVKRKHNSQPYTETQYGLFIEESENQLRNWIFIPENKTYIISSKDLSICSCLEKTKLMTNSKTLKYLTKRKIKEKIEMKIGTSKSFQVFENQNRIFKTTTADSFFPRIEYLFTNQNCIQIEINNPDEYKVTIFTKEITR